MTLPEQPRTTEAAPLPVVAVGGAAQILGVSATHVRWLERNGRLLSIRLENNQRIFIREDVEALARQRARRPRKRPGLAAK